MIIENFIFKRGGTWLSRWTSSYKRMFSRPRSRLNGSMTVEACFVLPFFLFAFLNVISIIDIYRLQGNMNASMHGSAKLMALYAYPATNAISYLTGDDSNDETNEDTNIFTDNILLDKLKDVILAYTYVEGRAKDDLGSAYPKDVNWYFSQILDDNDCVDLVAVYDVSPPVGLMGYKTTTMINRIRTRAWTGYDNAVNKDSSDNDELMVYITETGVAYHLSRACTYLKLSIVKVPTAAVGNMTNLNGILYTRCSECGSKAGDTVYVTNYGTKYHSALSCSKLKRTISRVPISQVGDKHACTRCGG